MNHESHNLASHRDIPQKREEMHRGQRSGEKLYVWFHGLFGFYVKPDHIVVVTPYMPEHSYFAGSWMNETEIKAGEWYRLRGVSNRRTLRTAPRIDATKAAVLSGISKVDLDASYFLLRLDFPKQIIPVRHVKATFTGKAKDQLPSQFPLVHLFEYDLNDPDCLSVESLDWQPMRNPGSLITNLHIFAEPQELVPNEHAMHAFMMLVSMFPGTDLRLDDSSYKYVIPLDPNVPTGNLPCGLDPNQEMSLAERPGAKSGTQPANCFALIGQP